MALALAEAALAAATQGVASFGVEKDESSFEVNDIKEKMDAIEFVGPASARAWACVESLRVATVDEAMASLSQAGQAFAPRRHRRSIVFVLRRGVIRRAGGDGHRVLQAR